MEKDLHIIPGNLDDPRIVALLETHVRRARAQTAPGSAHALDVNQLKGPEIDFWALWNSDEPVGVAALKHLSDIEGEVKSMYVDESLRGRGAGSRLIAHIITTARKSGMKKLSLETGSWDYFRPAWVLYARHGFVDCPPFGDYRPDPNSRFMTLDLTV